jgi:hypothetical protein
MGGNESLISARLKGSLFTVRAVADSLEVKSIVDPAEMMVGKEGRGLHPCLSRLSVSDMALVSAYEGGEGTRPLCWRIVGGRADWDRAWLPTSESGASCDLGALPPLLDA